MCGWMSGNRLQKCQLLKVIYVSCKGLECNERFFRVKEGVCIDPSTPGSVPSGPGAPAVHLMSPTEDLFPAPICQGKGALIPKGNFCQCDTGSTALEMDESGRLRGNCTG